MRFLSALAVTALILGACNDSRVYQEYKDFQEPYWLVTDKPEFEFIIEHPEQQYNLYCNIRNSVSYPYSRLFVTYSLQDSTGNDLHKALFSDFLFEPKSGKPFGSSGLGDLYDHEFLLLKNYQFKYAGKYKMKFEQFMRTDTLEGIFAVGLKIEQGKVQN